MKLNPKLKQDLKKYLADRIRRDRQNVIVYSSVKLSNDDIQLLKASLSNISFQNAQYRIDDSLLAGIKVTVGSKVIDLSIKGTLSNLRHIVYEAH